MKKTRTHILKVSYEFMPSDPAEAMEVRCELNRVFDALFEAVLKVKPDGADARGISNQNKTFLARNRAVDNSV